MSGNPANMVLQRACSLMGTNLGLTTHSVNLGLRTGNVHWGTTFAENEDSPWLGLNEQWGYDADESVLVAFGGKITIVPFHQIEVVNSTAGWQTIEGSPEIVATCLKTFTNMQGKGAIITFCPDTAKVWKEKWGFETVQELQDWMWDNATWTKEEWFKNYWANAHSFKEALSNERGTRTLNPDHMDLPDDGLVPMFMSPKWIAVVVAGGSGQCFAWGPAGLPQVISIDKWR